ncbi:N-acetylmuramoyl-L-alanine amidase, partial [Janthinobacterium sp.]|uniref:N-acetylmuramoyl-L-alanine amidase n=1 Tax=Janthinobacterium sp. TaxID=1871054 RepID=UPI002625A966
MAIKTTHAGHGGNDSGAVGNGYIEATVARIINDKFKLHTNARDCSENGNMTQSQRLSSINKKVNAVATSSDWNLSHHLNAGGGDGVEVWYYAGSSEGKAMATKVSAEIAKATGMKDRGAKPTSSLAVIRGTKGKMLLIEWAFIDNKSNMFLLMANMDNAIKGVLQLFGYDLGSVTPNPNPNPSETQQVAYKVLYSNLVDEDIARVFSWGFKDCQVQHINDFKSWSAQNLY